MKLTQNIFLALHILAVAAMVLLLLRQAGKSVKMIPKGFTHAGLTALVAGVVLTGVHPALHKHYPLQYGALNMGTVAVKLLVLVAVLVLAFKHEKQESIKTSQWWTLLGLIVVNIGLASTLK
jgi:hypothetical protein